MLAMSLATPISTLFKTPCAMYSRASGTLEAHYAPRAKLRLMPAEQLRAAAISGTSGG